MKIAMKQALEKNLFLNSSYCGKYFGMGDFIIFAG